MGRIMRFDRAWPVLAALLLASGAAGGAGAEDKPSGAPVEFQVGPKTDPEQLEIAKKWVTDAGCDLKITTGRLTNRIRVFTNGHHSAFKDDPLGAGAWAVDVCTKGKL